MICTTQPSDDRKACSFDAALSLVRFLLLSLILNHRMGSLSPKGSEARDFSRVRFTKTDFYDEAYIVDAKEKYASMRLCIRSSNKIDYM